MGIVVVKPRLQMEEPANVGRHNPHTDTVELQGIIQIRVLVTIIIAEILMGNQVVFGATQQILTSAGNIVTHCQKRGHHLPHLPVSYTHLTLPTNREV